MIFTISEIIYSKIKKVKEKNLDRLKIKTIFLIYIQDLQDLEI